MSKLKIETGSSPAEERFSITVTEKGPFLVYGRPPLAEQFIMPNEQNESWYFQEGRRFSTEAEPTALCRCGASKRKPDCDGSHETEPWDPTLTAPSESLLDKAETVEGGTLTMTDNPKYCVFARFCHPGGDAWTLTERSADPEARQLAIREASMCPGGRLTAWDRKTGSPYEFRFAPSLGLIEDVTIGSSGGLWIRGGIPLRREDGRTYEKELYDLKGSPNNPVGWAELEAKFLANAASMLSADRSKSLVQQFRCLEQQDDMAALTQLLP